MAIVQPFKGLRPNPAHAQQLATLPYDVVDSDEARELAKDNPFSFWHITKPEIDLPPEIDPYSDEVYRKGAENFSRFRREAVLLEEPESCFYLYQQIMGDHVQTGYVGCVSVDEYLAGIIKKHEHTRPDKVKDRVRLMEALNAQTGPVFLAYRQNPEMKRLTEEMLDKSLPLYDFVSFYNVRHRFFKIDYPPFNDLIREAFARIPALYIADGHHRSEAAAEFCLQKRRELGKYSGKEEFNYFLAVIFPHSDLQILPYNRVVKDLMGRSPEAFLQELERSFSVEPLSARVESVPAPQQFGLYLAGRWYLLRFKKPEKTADDVIARLDVSILQNYVLQPLLGINDPRTDKRIHFIGGIRGAQELERLVDSGEFAAAFSLYPTRIEQVMDVADAGQVMPPKSTWFEPKLLSGFVTHLLD